MQIQPEQPQDAEAIYALTTAAFASEPFSSGTEAHIINLRKRGALTLSLVAVDNSGIVGHIAFSAFNSSSM